VPRPVGAAAGEDAVDDRLGEVRVVEHVGPRGERLVGREAPEVVVDLCLSWIISLGRRGTENQVRPLRAELARPSRNRALLESHLGCRVRFKTGRNALVFRDADLDLPFVTQNDELLAAVRDQLETALEERTVAGDVREQVKQTLRRSLAGKRPTLPDVARELCMSPRTLQRRLTDAGITFQQVVEETRRELARHYLGKSGWS
jgi:AraC-like DNA-binding protein